MILEKEKKECISSVKSLPPTTTEVCFKFNCLRIRKLSPGGGQGQSPAEEPQCPRGQKGEAVWRERQKMMEQIMEERGEKATGCTSGAGDPNIAAVGSSETPKRREPYLSDGSMTCSALENPTDVCAQEGLALGERLLPL